MNIRATFKNIYIGTNLKPELVFGVEKVSESLEKLINKKVVINIEKYKGQRSLDANRVLLDAHRIIKRHHGNG